MHRPPQHQGSSRGGGGGGTAVTAALAAARGSADGGPAAPPTTQMAQMKSLLQQDKVEAEKEHRINQLEVALRGRQEANREAKSRLAGTLAKIRVLRSRVSADDAKLTTPTRGQKATPDDTDLGAPRRSGRWTTWGISALAASAAFLAWGFQTALRSHLSGTTDEPAKSNNSRPTQKPVVVLILPDNLSASSAEFLWTLVKALFM